MWVWALRAHHESARALSESVAGAVAPPSGAPPVGVDTGEAPSPRDEELGTEVERDEVQANWSQSRSGRISRQPSLSSSYAIVQLR